MNCINCEHPAVDSWYGPWCDTCGGVYTKSGQLFFRHVATVDGQGGRYAVVFDISGPDYRASYLAPEGYESQSGPPIDSDFAKSNVLTVHGSLDAVLAILQPVARGNSEEWPKLSGAPSSTEIERKLLGIE